MQAERGMLLVVSVCVCLCACVSEFVCMRACVCVCRVGFMLNMAELALHRGAIPRMAVSASVPAFLLLSRAATQPWTSPCHMFHLPARWCQTEERRRVQTLEHMCDFGLKSVGSAVTSGMPS